MAPDELEEASLVRLSRLQREMGAITAEATLFQEVLDETIESGRRIGRYLAGEIESND